MQNQARINNGNNKVVRSFGLCYKLYTFIVYGVIGRGLKRLTSGISSTDIPIMLPDDEEHLMQKPGATSNEIVVEFKQNSELEYWNRQWQRNDDDHKRKRQIDENQKTSRHVDQDQELVFAASNGGRKKSAEKNVATSSGSAPGVADSGKLTNGKKDKNVAATERLVTWGAEQKVEPMHHEQQSSGHRPILSVLVNINEKSDEFIRKKKEAIRKIYSSASDHIHS